MLHCRCVKLRLQLKLIDPRQANLEAPDAIWPPEQQGCCCRRTKAQPYCRWVRLLSASVGAAQRAAGVLHVLGGKRHLHMAWLVVQTHL